MVKFVRASPTHAMHSHCGACCAFICLNNDLTYWIPKIDSISTQCCNGTAHFFAHPPLERVSDTETGLVWVLKMSSISWQTYHCIHGDVWLLFVIWLSSPSPSWELTWRLPHAQMPNVSHWFLISVTINSIYWSYTSHHHSHWSIRNSMRLSTCEVRHLN